MWNGNDWMNYGRFLYSYNSSNYFTHGFYELWDNGSWILGDGVIEINNPDGFVDHLLTNEVYVYYSKISNVEDDEFNLEEYELSQNYPNPFNPNTTINYSISNPGYVTLKVYDILGKEVTSLVNEEKPAGIYEIEFDGRNLASGIYIYKLSVNNYSDSKKLILLK